MRQPKIYTNDELGSMSKKMAAEFVGSRCFAEDPLIEYYHLTFDKAKVDALEVFEKTNDLKSLVSNGQELLTSGYLQILRSMNRPTVSEDDFKNLSGAGTTAASRFGDLELSEAALKYLWHNLNTDLFPWLLSEDSTPTELEREAAVTAVAALVADRKTKTYMRCESSRRQENAVKQALIENCGMIEIKGKKGFDNLLDGPKPGEMFAQETMIAGNKVDIVIGLFDKRIMCLECKVSNTELNSYKRLNHEVVNKAKKWNEAFGKQCITGAILQGCFKKDNLKAAQDEGVYLFWSSDLKPLIDFINSTKSVFNREK